MSESPAFLPPWLQQLISEPDTATHNGDRRSTYRRLSPIDLSVDIVRSYTCLKMPTLACLLNKADLDIDMIMLARSMTIPIWTPPTAQALCTLSMSGLLDLSTEELTPEGYALADEVYALLHLLHTITTGSFPEAYILSELRAIRRRLQPGMKIRAFVRANKKPLKIAPFVSWTGRLRPEVLDADWIMSWG